MTKKGILYIAVSLAFIFGVFYAFKYVSYKIFYEGMVEQTITEMVKPEYLK